MTSLFSTGIRPVIDQWLLNKAKEQRSYGDYWSASSGGYCMRRQIFERLGVPPIEKDSDARKQRVFTAGHIFHQWAQSITKEAGLSIAQELELQDEGLMIRGHIDDLVLVDSGRLTTDSPLTFTDDTTFTGTAKRVEANNGEKTAVFTPKQHLILYDYKTQNSRAFSYKRPEMSHYHKMQLGTYMYMLRNLAWAELERRKK